jgi:Arc/MetJ family transcription regulator
MWTNLKIDDELLNKAHKLSGLPTKSATVDAVLKEYLVFLRRREDEKKAGLRSPKKKRRST